MRSQLRELIFMGHRRRPDWSSLNPSLARSAPAISRNVVANCSAQRKLIQYAHDRKIEAARVNLADGAEHDGKAEARAISPSSATTFAASPPNNVSRST
jgi:hypothetical protein